jgi:hypothetical protein
MNFVLKLLSIDGAAAPACSGRITGLKHEIRDYPVEYDIVVITPMSKC